MELSEFDQPFNELEQRVVSWVTEALDLRHGAAGDPKGSINGWGSPEDTISDTTDLLLRVRTRADRIDELLAKATQAKSRAKLARDAAKFEADNAYDEAARSHSTRRVEFSSAKERDSEARLDALEQRRIAHQAERLVEITATAHEVIRDVHWQLDALRKDLRGTLHALQFESTLER